MSVNKLLSVKALFFDMDNTIINTREGDVKNCNKLNHILNEKFDVEYETADKLTSLFLKNFREVRPIPNDTYLEWRLALWKDALGPSLKHIADEVDKEWQLSRFRYVKASSDVKSLLCELKSLYRLALITNGSSVPQWEKINECGLKSYFDTIVVSGDTPWKKPAAEVFQKACDELSVKPEQCIMVGDRYETDVLGAKNAEFAATVWLFYDSSYQIMPEKDNYPDFIVNNVLELKQILSQLNTGNWNNIS